MQLHSFMNLRQYQGAVLAGVEAIPTVEVRKHPDKRIWEIPWDSKHTNTLINLLKSKEPSHEMKRIPYETLRSRLIVIHRNTKNGVPCL